MKCDGCLVAIQKNAVKYGCSVTGCGKTFCSLCANVPSNSTDLRTWKCPACCTIEKKSGDNSKTPIRTSYHSENVTLRRSNKAVSSPAVDIPTQVLEVGELTSEIRNLTQEISSLKQKLEDATISLVRCHERLDELSASMATTDSRLRKSETEVIVLKANISQLKCELNTQAQHRLSNEIEIAGIPEMENENLADIICEAGRKIGIEIGKQDIDWIARAGPRRTASTRDGLSFPRPVVARLLSRTKRNDVLKVSKSTRNLNSNDLKISGPSSKTYFNERLTRENRQLFRESRTLSKENKYDHCWCNNGRIFVRQRQGKPAIHIATQEDLHRIFNPAGISGK